MKTVLYIFFIIEGLTVPVHTVLGDKFYPIIFEKHKQCVRYGEQFIGTKRNYLPPAIFECRTVPDKLIKNYFVHIDELVKPI